MAAACPIRKKLIKEKSKQIRDRVRSRSRSKPSSYSAAATNEHQPKTNRTHTVRDQTVNATKEITATILTAIVASHYVETLKRGSFQNTLDKIFEANGLPRVVIPIDEIINDVSDTMNDIIREAREKQTVNEAEAVEMEEIPDASYGQKRSRTTDSPQESEIHKKQREELIPMARERIDSQTEPGISSKRSVPEQQEHNIGTQQHSQSQLEQQKQQGQLKQTQGSQSQQTKQPPNKKGEQTNATKPKTDLNKSRRDSIDRILNEPTKNYDITIFIKDSDGISLKNIYTDKEEDTRERIGYMVTYSRAKVTWNHPKLTRSTIMQAFNFRKINLMDVKYISLSENACRSIQSEYVPLSKKHT